MLTGCPACSSTAPRRPAAFAQRTVGQLPHRTNPLRRRGRCTAAHAADYPSLKIRRPRRRRFLQAPATAARSAAFGLSCPFAEFAPWTEHDGVGTMIRKMTRCATRRMATVNPAQPDLNGIFCKALDCPSGPARGAPLDRACRDDATLREQAAAAVLRPQRTGWRTPSRVLVCCAVLAGILAGGPARALDRVRQTNDEIRIVLPDLEAAVRKSVSDGRPSAQGRLALGLGAGLSARKAVLDLERPNHDCQCQRRDVPADRHAGTRQAQAGRYLQRGIPEL